MIGIPKPICTTQSAPPVAPAPPKAKKPLYLTLQYVPVLSVGSNSPLYPYGLGAVQTAGIELNGQLQEIEVNLPDTGGIRGEFKGLSVFASFENVKLTPFPNPHGFEFILKYTNLLLDTVPQETIFNLATGGADINLADEMDSLSPYFRKVQGTWLIDATLIPLSGIDEYENQPTYVQYKLTGNLDSIRKRN
jgi:hypothetical protein